jgi:hypothetical protein
MLGPPAHIKKTQASVELRLMMRCYQPTTPFQALGPWTPFWDIRLTQAETLPNVMSSTAHAYKLIFLTNIIL